MNGYISICEESDLNLSNHYLVLSVDVYMHEQKSDFLRNGGENTQ